MRSEVDFFLKIVLFSEMQRFKQNNNYTYIPYTFYSIRNFLKQLYK